MKTILKLAGFLTLMVGVVGFASCNPKDTTPAETKPAAPTGLTVSKQTTTSVELSWNVVEGASSYTVVYNTVGGEEKKLPNIKQLKRTVTGLTENTEYEWSVYAVNGLGDGPATAGENFTTLETVVPNPTGLAVSGQSPTGGILSWDVIADATHFNLEVNGPIADGTTQWANKLPVAQFGGGGNLEGLLVPESDYTWRLQTVIGEKVSEWVSGPNFSTTADSPIPSAYSNLVGNYTATGTPSWLQAPGPSSWNGAFSRSYNIPQASNGNPAASYAFEMAKAYGNGSNLPQPFFVKSDNKLYVDDGYWIAQNIALTNGKTVNIGLYVFYTDATDSNGNPTISQIYDADADFGQQVATWDNTTGKLTYPTSYKSRPIAFAIVGIDTTDGTPYFMSDLYKNVEATVTPGSGRAPQAAFSGAKVELSAEMKIMKPLAAKLAIPASTASIAFVK